MSRDDILDLAITVSHIKPRMKAKLHHFMLFTNKIHVMPDTGFAMSNCDMPILFSAQPVMSSNISLCHVMSCHDKCDV